MSEDRTKRNLDFNVSLSEARVARRRPSVLFCLRRGQANQLGEQRIEALPAIRVRVDPANLLCQPLKLRPFLEPRASPG